uniref:Uncharacterized protein n=1 Tax=uncultured prokaryote TaxID=198431 RepID=A0A0H5Q7C0_9ZZZZ|nr:hypothetical protein [uncultured prokaryote]
MSRGSLDAVAYRRVPRSNTTSARLPERTVEWTRVHTSVSRVGWSLSWMDELGGVMPGSMTQPPARWEEADQGLDTTQLGACDPMGLRAAGTVLA